MNESDLRKVAAKLPLSRSVVERNRRLEASQAPTTAEAHNAPQVGHCKFTPAQDGFEPLPVARKGNNDNRVECKIPDAVVERHEAPALGGAVPGEAQSLHRAFVRFTGYRVQPLDPDNFAGSVKDLLDGLRHAGLIPGDEPWRIRLETEQEKVAHFADEKTVIEIVV